MSDIAGKAGSKSKIIGVDGQTVKAWCLSSEVAIRDSFNVGSMTDVGTGTYRYNMIQAQPSDDFVCSGNNCDMVDTSAQIFQIYKFANQNTINWTLNVRQCDNNAPSFATADAVTETYSFVVGR